MMIDSKIGSRERDLSPKYISEADGSGTIQVNSGLI
jgi:hypothetical protein